MIMQPSDSSSPQPPAAVAPQLPSSPSVAIAVTPPPPHTVTLDPSRSSAPSAAYLAYPRSSKWAIINFPNSVYEGEVKKGAAHGYGRLVGDTGVVYEGHWEGNRKHGHGKKWFVDGSIYDGKWQEDQRHGWATVTDAQGRVTKEEWSHDVLVHATPISISAQMQYAAQPTGVVISAGCPLSPLGHSYRKRWTCCDYILCCFCLCAFQQKKRICKLCGHRSD